MTIVTSDFAFNFEIQDVFLVGKVEINKWEGRGQNQQLEMTKDLGVI
jgi:hypothetical protein